MFTPCEYRPEHPDMDGTARTGSLPPSSTSPIAAYHPRGHSDFPAPSKFIQAMRNHNWRQRESTEDSESSAVSPAWAQLPSQNRQVKATHEPVGVRDADLIDLTSPPTAHREEHTRQSPSPEPSSPEPLGDNHHTGRAHSHTHPSRQPGNFRVMDHRHIPQHYPLSIIELQSIGTPLSDGEDPYLASLEAFGEAFGEASRPQDQSPTPISNDTSRQAQSRMDTLSRYEEMSREMGHQLHPASSRFSQVPTSDPEEHRQEGALENHLDHHEERLVPGNLPERFRRHREPAAQDSGDTQMSQRSMHEDPGYQRLLKILHGTHKSTSQRASEPRPAENTVHYSKDTDLEGVGQQSLNNTRTQVPDVRRTYGSTDSGYASLSPRHAFRAAGPAINATSATFNPKAREFLSLSGREKASESSHAESHSKFRPVSLDHLFAKSAENPVERESNMYPPPPSEPRQDRPRDPGPSPFMPAPSMQPPGMNYMNNPIYGMGPATNGPPQYLPPDLPRGFGNFAYPFSFPMAGPSWYPGMPMPGCFPFMGMGPQPPPSLAMPPAAPRAYQPMYLRRGPRFGPRMYPAPVPKPTIPDPKDQQAYEAWIEWRKANEPGYAMQCRMRQKRRSNRGGMIIKKPATESAPRENPKAPVNQDEPEVLVDNQL